jgi:hypothetical protein
MKIILNVYHLELFQAKAHKISGFYLDLDEDYKKLFQICYDTEHVKVSFSPFNLNLSRSVHYRSSIQDRWN